MDFLFYLFSFSLTKVPWNKPLTENIMKLSTTICLALVVALCYLVTVESSPIQKDDVSEKKNEVARQSGPIVSPAVPGGSDDDDDDDGKR